MAQPRREGIEYSNHSCPLVSYIILSYNQKEFIGNAVRSALAQDYDDIEFIISDDGSTDGTEDVLERVVSEFAGRRCIRIIGDGRNRGLAGNLNRAFGFARGQYCVVHAGDDVAGPSRVSRIVDAFNSNPSAMAVFSDSRTIDANGRVLQVRLKNWADGLVKYKFAAMLRMAANPPYHGAAAAYRRVLFDRFGGVASDVVYEDLTMVFRALLLGEIYLISDPLVDYRVHPNNLSAGTLVTRLDTVDGFERYIHSAPLHAARLRAFLEGALRDSLLIADKGRRSVWRAKWLYRQGVARVRLEEYAFCKGPWSALIRQMPLAGPWATARALAVRSLGYRFFKVRIQMRQR